ncbi:MAG: 16S rRNA (cytosine(1402)-N(4))-methyltransferase RsmH [candidate division Zixibacteria bacterium]|nr:16S rRNA (cytosine(1402)-N(4))-methyltransferase RsmH [candidate division Zixibacteria bacterium]
MVEEVAAAVARRPGGVFVDATVGGGGHAAALLAFLPEDNVYLGLDVDAAALERARRRLALFGPRVVLERASFTRLGDAAGPYAGRVANVLFDLGLSSYQLADGSRGFSFNAAAGLDMRFDGDGSKLTAAEVVNTFDEERLADVVYEFGEERRARAIARAVASRRAQRPFADAADLAEVVTRAVGGRRGRLHPATRTFQALRIFVNDELAALEAALPEALLVMVPGARLFVVSYHSLEDRVVKRFFRASAARGEVEIVTRKAKRPAAEEVRANPRSRSARLRIAEKI